jgi:chromosome segregation ATPase
MKYINKLFKLSILLFATITLVNLARLRADSQDHTSTVISMNGPSKNKFKGTVSFEKEGRGILITSNSTHQNDKLLKLVAEKQSTNTYLIDYRLMRSCNFTINFTGNNNTNLKIGFSPRSLENKNKNEKFDIKLEVLNYSSFFPKVVKKVEAVQAEISKQCEARKAKVQTLKATLINKFTEYKGNVENNKKLNVKLSSTKKSTDGFNSSIDDIRSQIDAINALQKSYEGQKKNLQILKKGSNKLLRKERKDLKLIQDKNNEIDKKIKENEAEIKKFNEKDNNLKKNYENFVLEQKGLEEEIINLNKKLSDTDQQISSLARNKLSDEYEIQYAKSTQKEIKVLIDEIKNQTEKFKNSKIASQKKSDNLNKSKDALEKGIKQNKAKIRTIDEQINELILKKTKIEEEVKEQYNSIKAKEDELSTIDIENQQISSNVKRLEDKLKANKNNLENIQEKHTYLSAHQQKYKNKLTNLNGTRNNHSSHLHTLESKKAEILKKIKNSKVLVEKNSNDTSNFSNVKFVLEKQISDNSIELKEKDSNVKNLEAEIKSYDSEIESIDKTIASFKENKQNIQKILRELNKKLTPYTNENKNLTQERNRTDEILTTERREIRAALAALKKNVPATKMIADIIEDEFSSSE